MMTVIDLIGRLKEVEEAFEKMPMSLQQDRKLYLMEEEWDARRRKREAENHSGGGGAGKGCKKGHGRGHGGSSSGGSSSGRPTSEECRCCSKLVH
jgi:uncharacterized membrane protein YgcG